MATRLGSAAKPLSVLFLWLVAAGCAVSFLVIVGLLQADRIWPGPWLAPWASLLDVEGGWPRFERAVIFAVLGVSAILVSLLLLTRRRRERRLFQVAASETGFVVIDEDSVEVMLAEVAVRVRGVASVQVDLSTDRSRSLRVRLSVGLMPSAMIALVTKELQERVRDVVANVIGLPVGSVSVRARVLAPGELGVLLS